MTGQMTDGPPRAALERLGLGEREVLDGLSGARLDEVAEGATGKQALGVLMALYLVSIPGLAERSGVLVMGADDADAVRIATFSDQLDVRGLPEGCVERHDARSIMLRLAGLTPDHPPFALVTPQACVVLSPERLAQNARGDVGWLLGEAGEGEAQAGEGGDEGWARDALPSLDALDALAEGDAWLEGLGALAREMGDVYSSAVFAGALRRHGLEDATARVERLLAGEPDGRIEALRAWSRGLSEGAATSLLQMALTEVDQVERGLADALRTLDVERGLWRQALVGLAERRDALEDAVSVLGMRGEARALGPSLSALDRLGERVVVAAPLIGEAAARERLRRAHRLEPIAWWARLSGEA